MTRANTIMTPHQFERLLDRLTTVRNTDDLFDLELRLGPLDEEDALSARALYHIACMRCNLSRGPAPSPDRFKLDRPAPVPSREWFDVRGRMDTRIVRVGWADGTLYGSLYALARLDADDARLAHPASARAMIIGCLDVVLDESEARSVA